MMQPTNGGPPHMAPDTDTAEPMHSGGPTLSPQDLAMLAAAFTPDVLAVLGKLASGVAEPAGDMQEELPPPRAAPPALARPQTMLGKV